MNNCKKVLVLFFAVLLVAPASLTYAQTVPSDAPTPTPETTVAPTPTPGTNIALRKSIYALTPDELQRFANALNTIRANGTYQRFMDRHMQAMMTSTTQPNESGTQRNVAHRGPSFLPWHRSLVREFEQTLQAVDPSVTVPYWPFESETLGTLPRVFSAPYVGGDGDPVEGNRVVDGPFASWNITRMIGRDPEGVSSLPNQGEVDALMQIATYDAAPYSESATGFRNAVEGWIGTNDNRNMHNRVHDYVGGDMLPRDSMSTNVVNDPVFWLVHANIDRLWWQWQQIHGINNYAPNDDGPTGHNLNDRMQFLNNFITPASTLDIRSMGYVYQ